MLKQILIYVAGLVTGILIMFGIGLAASNSAADFKDEKVYLKSPGDCISTYKLKVIQALETGYALAENQQNYGPVFPEKSDEIGNDGSDLGTGLIVLLYSPGKTSFYDGQIIRIPKGSCARQIGVYKYMNSRQIVNTVPIVQIMKNNK